MACRPPHVLPKEGKKSRRQTSPNFFLSLFLLLPTAQLDRWHELDGESVVPSGGSNLSLPLFISRGSNDGVAILTVVRRKGDGKGGAQGDPANRDEHQLAGKLTTNTYASWPR